MQTANSISFHEQYAFHPVVKYNEAELINALSQKDRNAFSYLYDMYAPALNGIIYKAVKNKELTEDILQEVFVKIWNNFSQYDTSKGRLYTWMATITKNLAIDALRSKVFSNKLKTVHLDDSLQLNNKDCEFKQFDSLNIDKYLIHLDAKHLVLINMAYFNDMTQDEISKYAGMPLGTVKTRLRAAIQQLRKVIAAKEYSA